MEKRVRMDCLLGMYGPLLTEKRAEALRLSLREDLSLAEIADMTGVSRQAVHDGILRAERQLESFEQALGFLKAREETDRAIGVALAALDAGQTAAARDILNHILDGE